MRTGKVASEPISQKAQRRKIRSLSTDESLSPSLNITVMGLNMSDGEIRCNTKQNLLEIQQGIHRHNVVSSDRRNKPQTTWGVFRI